MHRIDIRGECGIRIMGGGSIEGEVCLCCEQLTVESLLKKCGVLMRKNYYVVLGFGTLVVDAYLVLASIASGMMKSEYRMNLPLFGEGSVLASSRLMVLMIATWTALLAIGCLRGTSTSEGTNVMAIAPFVLILALGWTGHLLAYVL